MTRPARLLRADATPVADWYHAWPPKTAARMINLQLRELHVAIDGQEIPLRKAVGLQTIEHFDDIVYISTKSGLCQVRRGETVLIAYIANRIVITAGEPHSKDRRKAKRRQKMPPREVFLAIFGSAVVAGFVAWVTEVSDVWAGQ